MRFDNSTVLYIDIIHIQANSTSYPFVRREMSSILRAT